MKTRQNRPACASLLACLIASLPLVLGGCAVREQFFGCEGQTAGTGPDEFVMTPTSLRFQSIRYHFTEERTTHRVYTHKETGQQITFYPASGVLKRGELQWSCRRIES